MQSSAHGNRRKPLLRSMLLFVSIPTTFPPLANAFALEFFYCLRRMLSVTFSEAILNLRIAWFDNIPALPQFSLKLIGVSSLQLPMNTDVVDKTKFASVATSSGKGDHSLIQVGVGALLWQHLGEIALPVNDHDRYVFYRKWRNC